MLQVFGIQSLQEFLTAVEPLWQQWKDVWFRGHADAEWALVPKSYRREDYVILEDDLRSEFERLGSQLLVEDRPANAWEWYFLMQHYGAPTRLLDWTDGGLIATHFALRGHKLDSDAAVWMIDPVWLNQAAIEVDSVQLAGWPKTKPYLPEPYEQQLDAEYPIALDPKYIARRMFVQHSRFTVHGKNANGLDEIISRRPDARAAKIVIPATAVRHVKTQLQICGISETTIFPDLEGLSRELGSQWTKRRSATSA